MEKGNYLRILLSVLVAVSLVTVVFAVNTSENVDENTPLMTGEVPEIDRKEHEEYETAIFGVWCFWGPDARVGVVEGVIRTRTGYQEVRNATRDEYRINREALKVDYDPEKITYMELYEMISETGQIRELHPFGEFVLTSRHHQSYILGRHDELSESFKRLYPELDDFINSTAAARVNGFLAGRGELDSPEDLEGLGLTERGRREVYDLWRARKR